MEIKKKKIAKKDTLIHDLRCKILDIGDDVKKYKEEIQSLKDDVKTHSLEIEWRDRHIDEITAQRNKKDVELRMLGHKMEKMMRGKND